MHLISADLTGRKCKKCKAWDSENHAYNGMSFERWYGTKFQRISGYVCHNCGFMIITQIIQPKGGNHVKQ